MSTPGGDGVVSDAAGSPFPAADVDRELNPGNNKNVEVDPASSEVAASLETKARRKAVEEERKQTMQTLKTAFMVSGVIAAAAVAGFAIAKKLREN